MALALDRSVSVVDATELAIASADHLTDIDAGAVQALRALAVKIDTMHDYLDALSEDYADHNLRPPSPDNVTIPTYLKYCDALGLTPVSRGVVAPASARKAAPAAPERPAPTQTRLGVLQGLRPDAARGA